MSRTMFYTKRFLIYILCVCVTCDLAVNVASAEDNFSGAEYLQNAIRDIQVKNAERTVLTFVAAPNLRKVLVRKKPTVLQRVKPYLIDVNNRRFSAIEQQQQQQHEPQLFQAEVPRPVYRPEDHHVAAGQTNHGVHVASPSQPSHNFFSNSDPQPEEVIEHHHHEANSHHHDVHAHDATLHHAHTHTVHPHHVNGYVTSNNHVPEPPNLTKGEIAALYEAAVANGNSVQLNSLNYHGTANGIDDAVPVQAAIHEIHDPLNSYGTSTHHAPDYSGSSDAYYYYYYPLKTFLDGLIPRVPVATNQIHHHNEKYKSPVLQTSHTHLHNIKVEPIKTVMEIPAKQSKALEPLFMAISGFIGMAMMFMFTMVIFPKFTHGIFGIKKKRARQLNTDSAFPVTDLNLSNLFNNFINSIDKYECLTCNNISRHPRILQTFNSSSVTRNGTSVTN